MALTSDKIRRSRGTPITESIEIGTAGTIYVGSLACRRNTTGRAFAATAATGRRIAGVVTRLDSTTAGKSAGTGVGNTGGSQKALIEYGNEYLFTVATAIRTNTSLGLNVFVGDDDKVSGTAVGSAGTRVVAGRLVDWEASDKSTGWVAIAVFGPTDIAV